MKKILILILTTIVLIFAYSQYTEYQRFHPQNADYKISRNIDINYHDQVMVYNYNESITTLNNYVSTQWSANNINVKSPNEDTNKTQYAVNEYAKKLAKVKFYERRLEQSKVLKDLGFNNADVTSIEIKNMSVKAYSQYLKAKTFRQLMKESFQSSNLKNGEKSAFVYEVQKLLVKKGYNIPLDGVYKTITHDALKSFEEKHELFPDGKIDLITLNLLLI